MCEGVWKWIGLPANFSVAVLMGWCACGIGAQRSSWGPATGPELLIAMPRRADERQDVQEFEGHTGGWAD